MSTKRELEELLIQQQQMFAMLESMYATLQSANDSLQRTNASLQKLVEEKDAEIARLNENI